jgi:hypothetical protein
MSAAPPAPGPGAVVAEARELVDLCLQGAEVNDRDDLTRRLSAARRALRGTPSRDAVRDAASEVVRALDSLRIDLRTRRVALADPGHAARLRAELDRARTRFDDFQARCREWPQLLGEGFAALSSDAEFALRSRARAVIAEGEESIHAGDPKKTGATFDRWLRDRLAAEADATYALLLDRARQVAHRVAAQLQTPAHPLTSLRVTPPDRLVAELPARQPSATGRPAGPARMLGIVMPTYGGIMMAIVMSRILNLRLPGWLLVTCAIVGAAALGGAAIAGERKRQLDRRRSDAKAVLRATVEEYQLSMGKQIRDAARMLQHDLRRAGTAMATERSGAVTAELDAAREAVETVRAATANLTDIADDLDSVAQLQDRAQRLLRALPAPGSRKPALDTVA